MRIATMENLMQGAAPVGSARELDPGRVVADLRELHQLTSDIHGAQRLCWTPTWVEARRWFRAQLEQLPVTVRTDPAGNVWATLPGQSEASLVIGGHIDSVPNGGWLDGTLNLVAGLEVLRCLAAHETPAATVQLVDWADEEGARFGYGMLGSRAASGALESKTVKSLRDADGALLSDVLSQHGVQVDRMGEARLSPEEAAAYVELHIEQGPVLERRGLPLAAVIGTCGVERHVVRFSGQMAHIGSSMDDRRDPLAAAARLSLAIRADARERGSIASVGRFVASPGIATAVAAECEITLDQRDFHADQLASAVASARRDAADIAADERVQVEWSRLWGLQPMAFHPELVDIVETAIKAEVGVSHRMPSPILHDAAEMARAGIPTAMLFVQSLRGLSHAREEDTRTEHIELSVRALARVVDRTLGWVVSRGPVGRRSTPAAPASGKRES
jgi:N-carbamoyl-L-amino-acid hydrolase